MKRTMLAVAAALSLAVGGSAAVAGELDPALQAALSDRIGDADVPVIIRFNDTVDMKALRRDARRLAKARHPDDARKQRRTRRRLKRRMLVDALKAAGRDSRRALRRLVVHFLDARAQPQEDGVPHEDERLSQRRHHVAVLVTSIDSRR